MYKDKYYSFFVNFKVNKIIFNEKYGIGKTKSWNFLEVSKIKKQRKKRNIESSN